MADIKELAEQLQKAVEAQLVELEAGIDSLTAENDRLARVIEIIRDNDPQLVELAEGRA